MNANGDTPVVLESAAGSQKQVENSFGDSLQVATISYMSVLEWVSRLGHHSPQVYMLTDTGNVS